jgi:putative DNA methylase
MASEQRLTDSGILEAKHGKVRLKRRKEFALDWFPKSEIIWAVVQHLCRALDEADGLERCGVSMADLSPSTLDQVKVLSYRVYRICDGKGWAEEALAYNNLVAVWGSLEGKIREAKKRKPKQCELGL